MTKTVVKNDYGFYLNFTLTNADGTALDLTSNTAIAFNVADATSGTILFSGTPSVVSAVGGTCRYLVATGDFDTVGTYNYEIQVSYSGKVITAKPTDTIRVVSELA